MTELIDFCKNNNIRFLKEALLKDYLTFRVGGPCRLMVFPDTADKTVSLLKYVNDNNIRYFIIGKGSNLLCRDDGFDGVIINTSDFESADIRGDRIICSSGISLMKVCRAALDNSLSGLECEYGIPGSVGGAVFMNAGAYGGETKDFITKVTYWDGQAIRTIDGSECDFGYRTSLFEKLNSEGKTAVILGFEAILSKGDKDEITAKVDDLRSRRTASQPLDVPSAGSTFKRPEGYFAARLIEDAGLKGFALDDSGAQVSPKHAGFIVNNGGTAKASDIIRLIDYVVEKVFENSGVRLDKEVRLVGNFGGF